MKRLISLALALICALGLLSCTEGKGEASNDEAYNYIVIEASDTYLIVAEIGEDGKAIKSMQYSVPNWFYPSTEIEVGYKISIKHNDIVLETFPMQFAEIYQMEYYDKESGSCITVIPKD